MHKVFFVDSAVFDVLLRLAQAESMTIGETTVPIPPLLRQWVGVACAPQVEFGGLGQEPGEMSVLLLRGEDRTEGVVRRWSQETQPPYVRHGGCVYARSDASSSDLPGLLGVPVVYLWVGELADLWGTPSGMPREQHEAACRAVRYLGSASEVIEGEGIGDEEDLEDARQVEDAARAALGMQSRAEQAREEQEP